MSWSPYPSCRGDQRKLGEERDDGLIFGIITVPDVRWRDVVIGRREQHQLQNKKPFTASNL